MKLLMKTHFPGSSDVPTVRQPTHTPIPDTDLHKVDHIVYMDRIKTIIKGFSTLKSAGPNGFPPAILKAFGEYTLKRLLLLYQASLLLGLNEKCYFSFPGKSSTRERE